MPGGPSGASVFGGGADDDAHGEGGQGEGADDNEVALQPPGFDGMNAHGQQLVQFVGAGLPKRPALPVSLPSSGGEFGRRYRFADGQAVEQCQK